MTPPAWRQATSFQAPIRGVHRYSGIHRLAWAVFPREANNWGGHFRGWQSHPSASQCLDGTWESAFHKDTLLSRKFEWGGAVTGLRQSSFESLSEGLTSSKKGNPDPSEGREPQRVTPSASLALPVQSAESLQPAAARAPGVPPGREVTSCRVVTHTGGWGKALEQWARNLTFPGPPLQRTTAVSENLMRTRCSGSWQTLSELLIGQCSRVTANQRAGRARSAD